MKTYICGLLSERNEAEDNLYEGTSYLINRELITPQEMKKREYDSLFFAQRSNEPIG